MHMNINLTSPHHSQAARKLKITTWKEESMDILIRSEGIELTERLREAVNRKIGRVRRYAPRAMRARVQLNRVNSNLPHQFRARVHYEIPGNDVVAEHTAHDPIAAVDLVTDKIERRLRRRKTARLARRVRIDRTIPDRWHALTCP